jgi:hypothetical protein
MAVLLSSTPRWPTPLTVTATTAAWAGTERTGGRPCRISRRLPATARLPALACGRVGARVVNFWSARTIAPNGVRCAHGEPPNGAPRVTMVSLPARRPLAMAYAPNGGK